MAYTKNDVAPNFVNGVAVEMTDEEKQKLADEWNAWESKSGERKLEQIRTIRNAKLVETDWKVTSAKEQGTNLSTSFKNWRQGLRDIPTTYTSESEYDELLARDDDGNLTHSVWSE
tara:strand:- start:618 stop:965 length:348 start_codon:yes stop_codon:yes gene_type:complete